jgi:uncharacterized protein (TIGR00251 family)
MESVVMDKKKLKNLLSADKVETGSAIFVLVTHLAGCNEIAGIQGDVVKVNLTARSMDGEANDELISLLSKQLRITRHNIEIVAGQSSNQKLVSILGLSPAEVMERLI